MTGIGSFKIPVGVNVKEGGEISFSLNKENFQSDIISVLTDIQTRQQFAFTGEDEIYTTTVNAGSNGYGRFTLAISGLTGVEDLLAKQPAYKAWYSDGQITITGEPTGEATAEVYDVQGRKLAVHNLEKMNLNQIEAPTGSNGIYLLRI